MTTFLTLLSLAGIIIGGVRLFARFQERRENKRLIELGEERERRRQTETSLDNLTGTLEAKHGVDKAVSGDGDSDWLRKLRDRAKARTPDAGDG